MITVVFSDLYDTSGQPEYDRLRPLSYPGTNVLLICFSITEPDSFQNVIEKWFPEIQHYCPNIPIILVGNKVDQRDDPEVVQRLREIDKNPITRIDGENLKNKFKAAAYIECSARSNLGITQVFDAAVRISVDPPKIIGPRRKFCTLL